MAEEGADFFFAHLVWMTLVVEKDSPREIASQPCLQITLSPRGLEILLALCSVASIESAFPVYQFEGRSCSCGHDEAGIMSLYAARAGCRLWSIRGNRDKVLGTGAIVVNRWRVGKEILARG